MVPQGAKMEAPSPPNGNREELEGAGGRERSPRAFSEQNAFSLFSEGPDGDLFYTCVDYRSEIMF